MKGQTRQGQFQLLGEVTPTAFAAEQVHDLGLGFDHAIGLAAAPVHRPEADREQCLLHRIEEPAAGDVHVTQSLLAVIRSLPEEDRRWLVDEREGDELSSEALASLAMEGGTFADLAEEPDLYSFTDGEALRFEPPAPESAAPPPTPRCRPAPG